MLKKAMTQLMLFPVRLLAGLKNEQNIQDKYIQNIIELYEKNGREFLSIYKRPRTVEGVISIEAPNEINASTAIIMQGQLVEEHDFTVETVRIYGSLYPGTTVIVSTWTLDNPKLVKRLEKEENCVVVLNSYPAHSGLLNVNYQIATTLAGIEKAKELGKKYVFKTRCDYRFYKKGLLQYLYCLINEYPLDSTVCCQKYRIVAGSEVRNSMFRPFWLADQFNYGCVEDMYSYWNYDMKPIDLDKKEVNKRITDEHMTWNERTLRQLAAEPEIVRSFLYRQEGSLPACTVKDYWSIIRSRFILVSREELGYFWVKYRYRYDEAASSGCYYSENDVKRCLNYNWDFSQWLLLYKGLLRYEERYEAFAEENRY